MLTGDFKIFSVVFRAVFAKSLGTSVKTRLLTRFGTWTAITTSYVRET